MTTPTRFGAGLRWLLIASLALNVAFVAGMAWRHLDDHGPRHGPPGHAMHRAPMPNPMLLRRVLTDDRRAVLDETLEAHRPKVRESVRAVMQARREVRALLAAERIDAPALEAAFADLRTRDAEAAAVVHAMLAELLPRLTPEERRQLAEASRPQHRRAARHDTERPARP